MILATISLLVLAVVSADPSVWNTADAIAWVLFGVAVVRLSLKEETR